MDETWRSWDTEEVGLGIGQPGAILNRAEPGVASMTEQATNLAGLVIVVDHERGQFASESAGLRLVADSAHALLSPKALVVVLNGQAIQELQLRTARAVRILLAPPCVELLAMSRLVLAGVSVGACSARPFLGATAEDKVDAAALWARGFWVFRCWAEEDLEVVARHEPSRRAARSIRALDRGSTTTSTPAGVSADAHVQSGISRCVRPSSSGLPTTWPSTTSCFR